MSSEPDWAAAAREAGWLPPGEISLRTWLARNMRGGRCRACGASRIDGPDTAQWFRQNDEPQPHRTSCRFYAGPVKHGYAGGRMGSFDFWISCT